MVDELAVPLLDLTLQYRAYADELNAAARGVMESQVLIGGPEVLAFEAGFAAYVEVSHAVACASGSDAILLALAAMDIQAGDEILCPAYSFFASAGYPARLGAKLRFVDIEPATCNICPSAAQRIASDCSNLKSILPVHLYGQSSDMLALENLADTLGVSILEDACQAVGSRDVDGRRVGGIGVAGAFSFYPTKNLGGFGDGGMVVTQDPELAERMRVLRNHGESKTLRYQHTMVGFNSRLDAIQAAILRVKLNYLDLWTQQRQENAALYTRLFLEAGAQDSSVGLADSTGDGLPLRVPFVSPDPAKHVYNQYVIRVPESVRPGLQKRLGEKNIGTGVYYPIPLHLQPCFADLGYREGDFPVAELAAKETMALPVFSELKEEQIRFVVRSVVAGLR